MPATPFDSALQGRLFGDPELGALLSDSAALRAMLLVEGALAEAQAERGVIPAEAAARIAMAAREAAPDPAALAPAVARDGVPVPALVAAFRAEIGDPQVAQYVHWGATSQDIVDTALALRLRRMLEILEVRLAAAVAALAALAEAHAARPMAARTWGQPATPTSLGAVAAAWGAPLLRHHARLAALRPGLLAVSLSGAAGTLAAMG